MEVRKLCFTDSKGIKTSKNKKKNRRGKDQQKSTCLYEANEIHEVSSNLNFACPSDELNKFMPSSSLTLKLQDLKDDRVEDMIGFDDGNIDDEIDPALKEKTDREVEDFARRLNSDWLKGCKRSYLWVRKGGLYHFPLTETVLSEDMLEYIQSGNGSNKTLIGRRLEQF